MQGAVTRPLVAPIRTAPLYPGPLLCPTSLWSAGGKLKVNRPSMLSPNHRTTVATMAYIHHF